MFATTCHHNNAIKLSRNVMVQKALNGALQYLYDGVKASLMSSLSPLHTTQLRGGAESHNDTKYIKTASHIQYFLGLCTSWLHICDVGALRCGQQC